MWGTIFRVYVIVMIIFTTFTISAKGGDKDSVSGASKQEERVKPQENQKRERNGYDEEHGTKERKKNGALDGEYNDKQLNDCTTHSANLQIKIKDSIKQLKKNKKLSQSQATLLQSEIDTLFENDNAFFKELEDNDKKTITKQLKEIKDARNKLKTLSDSKNGELSIKNVSAMEKEIKRINRQYRAIEWIIAD